MLSGVNHNTKLEIETLPNLWTTLSQVYLQRTNQEGVVLVSTTVDATNRIFKLESTSADVEYYRIDYATAHPDGTVSESAVAGLTKIYV